MPTERVLADFEGTWRIERDIIPAQGAPARFEGEGVWRWEGADLAYAESGMLRVAGATPMRAERRYRWAADMAVYFEDGRFFHNVPTTGGRALHFCDPDTYVVDYYFARWPVFEVTWTVKGPRKSYRMTSLFTRRAAP